MNWTTPNRTTPRIVRTPIQELRLVALIEDKASADETDFSRCGWFDSSLDLATGLQVTEFVDVLPDIVPIEVLS